MRVIGRRHARRPAVVGTGVRGKHPKLTLASKAKVDRGGPPKCCGLGGVKLDGLHILLYSEQITTSHANLKRPLLERSDGNTQKINITIQQSFRFKTKNISPPSY